ncbi:glycoside hydrolase family 9 protein [Streptomyces fuscigenes]|uniref:glycoside hydrolase family 9 protein n=1 Tax=Streptomyces fuscigenes TaxID=1528880 RepID=UPI001F37E7A9|nr:glycoside hydrolase family 9 protein [Streptomyces fuscigenes]MCF3963404.1 glycoside hydrolase family 9 protein [Streptomyces fuscigenes]
MATILTNHIGYNTAGSKKAVVLLPGPAPSRPAGAEGPGAARLVGEGVDIPLAVGPQQAVDRWTVGTFRVIDFSGVQEEGVFRIVYGELRSEPFTIGARVLQQSTLSDILYYFKSVRSSGAIERKDRTAGFYQDDSGRTVDARGGWLDASGDYSKFLSHLTYTRMMSPQQLPLCAWAFMEARDTLTRRTPQLLKALGDRLRDEALFGADFLVRFQSPEGYFYTAIFDALTKDLDERVINAPLQDSVRTQRWQAAYRQGGGFAIAALARASTLDDHGDFTPAEYLAAARRGFDHLEQHNKEYSFDGEESVLDDYCALMAAAELVRATPEDDPVLVAAAERRARQLMDRRTDSGRGFHYLVGDIEGRPYFHAAESGLPVVALLRYAEVCDGSATAAEARATALALAADAAALADEVPNPFGCARQYVQSTGAEPRTSFFFPHDNETGYWWQGENANISSAAYAASLASEQDGCPPELRERLRRLAEDQLHWVTGLNPFDSSMIKGVGRNNIEYKPDYPNVPGGILNGITGGFEDEHDIAFMPEHHRATGNGWRWTEQWIPHSAWFLLAMSAAR